MPFYHDIISQRAHLTIHSHCILECPKGPSTMTYTYYFRETKMSYHHILIVSQSVQQYTLFLTETLYLSYLKDHLIMTETLYLSYLKDHLIMTETLYISYLKNHLIMTDTLYLSYLKDHIIMTETLYLSYLKDHLIMTETLYLSYLKDHLIMIETLYLSWLTNGLSPSHRHYILESPISSYHHDIDIEFQSVQNTSLP